MRWLHERDDDRGGKPWIQNAFLLCFADTIGGSVCESSVMKNFAHCAVFGSGFVRQNSEKSCFRRKFDDASQALNISSRYQKLCQVPQEKVRPAH